MPSAPKSSDPHGARAFIALACKVAWADGVVEADERAYVLRLVERLSAPVTPEELDRWLTRGAPEAAFDELSAGLGQLFAYEAMSLAQADGDLSDVELEVLERIVHRVFEPHPKGTPLARIALQKRAR